MDKFLFSLMLNTMSRALSCLSSAQMFQLDGKIPAVAVQEGIDPEKIDTCRVALRRSLIEVSAVSNIMMYEGILPAASADEIERTIDSMYGLLQNLAESPDADPALVEWLAAKKKESEEHEREQEEHRQEHIKNCPECQAALAERRKTTH
jgi:uncharacterized Zn finger protein